PFSLKFLRYHLPAILWVAVVLVLTLLPAAAMPKTPEWELLSFDTFSHICFFSALAVLVVRSFYSHLEFRFLRYANAVGFAFCLILGILIELLQTVMKQGRHGEIRDVVSDLIGIFLGILVFYFLVRRRLVF